MIYIRALERSRSRVRSSRSNGFLPGQKWNRSKRICSAPIYIYEIVFQKKTNNCMNWIFQKKNNLKKCSLQSPVLHTNIHTVTSLICKPFLQKIILEWTMNFMRRVFYGEISNFLLSSFLFSEKISFNDTGNLFEAFYTCQIHIFTIYNFFL